MCGIFGAVGKDIDIDKCKVLMLLSEDRGNDATGITDGATIIKKADKASKFIHNNYNDIHSLDFNKSKLLIGHTRKSTVFSTSKEDECAHPFQYGSIIGVHNGKITNSDELGKELSVNFKVDSEAIFYMLYTMSSECAVDKILSKLEGYYAVVWYDQEKPNHINMIRHNADLSYTMIGNTLYYASNKDYLKALVGDEAIEELEVDTLHTININSLTVKKKKFELPKYVEPVTTTTHYNCYPYRYTCYVCKKDIEKYMDVEIIWELKLNETCNTWTMERREVCKECFGVAEQHERQYFNAEAEKNRRNMALMQSVNKKDEEKKIVVDEPEGFYNRYEHYN